MCSYIDDNELEQLIDISISEIQLNFRQEITVIFHLFAMAYRIGGRNLYRV